jgi:hypothetical protein
MRAMLSSKKQIFLMVLKYKKVDIPMFYTDLISEWQGFN